MQLAWATDIHLNFPDAERRRKFYASVKEQADALVVSGDIAESPSIEETLVEMDQALGMPLYFVLGNHDFYNGSIRETRKAVARTCAARENLVHLSDAGVVELTQETALVGHEGCGDARLGDFEGTEVILNDFLLIEELRHWNTPRDLDRPALTKTLRALGDEAAAHLETCLREAAARYRHVIVAMHVPPFREAAWHQGRISDDDFLPFFSCKAAGDALLAAARAAPKCDFLVLCGHTHGGGEIRVEENLRVLTAEAEYFEPEVNRVFSIEG